MIQPATVRLVIDLMDLILALGVAACFGSLATYYLFRREIERRGNDD